MEEKRPQNTEELKEEKEQIIEQTAAEISDIRLTGQIFRAQIDTAKKLALDMIKADNEQKRREDSLAAEKRAELIKRMGDAAKSGDLTEMQRIKDLLEKASDDCR